VAWLATKRAWNHGCVKIEIKNKVLLNERKGRERVKEVSKKEGKIEKWTEIKRERGGRERERGKKKRG